jgi:hypothetical protein
MVCMHISTSVVAAASVCMYILLNVLRGFYVLSPHDTFLYCLLQLLFVLFKPRLFGNCCWSLLLEQMLLQHAFAAVHIVLVT